MPRPVQARDLMSRPVRQLTAATPVRDAAAFLLRHGISGAPVLDEHGRWIGVFTQNDLARSVEHRLMPPTPEDLGRTPVKKFMTPGLFTVFPEATMEEVVRTMTTFKIHRVFVIDEAEGTLQGVITIMDVLRRLEADQGRTTIEPKSRTA